MLNPAKHRYVSSKSFHEIYHENIPLSVCIFHEFCKVFVLDWSFNLTEGTTES